MMALILALACSQQQAPPLTEAPVGFTLVYQGGVDGEIEPCG